MCSNRLVHVRIIDVPGCVLNLSGASPALPRSRAPLSLKFKVQGSEFSVVTLDVGLASSLRLSLLIDVGVDLLGMRRRRIIAWSPTNLSRRVRVAPAIP